MPIVQPVARLSACLSLAFASCLFAQESVPAPQQRSRGDAQRQVTNTRISPTWFDEGTKFWYRSELSGGKREFVLVDAVAGERRLAFDHERLAAALSEKAGEEVAADQLPIEQPVFSQEVVAFRFQGKSWKCEFDNYALSETAQYENSHRAGHGPIHPEDLPRASTETGVETEVRFINQTQHTVELFWLETGGGRSSYGKLAAGESRQQHTYAGHYWIVVDQSGIDLAAFKAEETTLEALIDGQPIDRRTQPPRGRGTRFRPQADGGVSPDGKWRAFIRGGNLFAQVMNAADSEPIQLSQDGTEDEFYSQVAWAPDSQALCAFRITPGERKEVYLIESSPRGGGRAKLSQRPYALPGDRFTSYEVRLFRLEEAPADSTESGDPAKDSWQEVPCQCEPIDFGRPRVRWDDDSRAFSYTKTDRGHQRFRLIRVNASSGEAQAIIDEQTDTFIWTAHTENLGVRSVTHLEESNEILYVSEVDGHRHLYLVDPSIDPDSADATEPQIANGKKRLFAPGLSNQITSGNFVVRAIDLIDEETREIWFQASGGVPDQDPYFLHFYRVNFDGTGLVQLTSGNGNHSIQFSPDRRFLIDTYSRVDAAPRHELRDAQNGELICELEQADITVLENSGWRAPEVFVAKGRDGKTDIWGILCRPRDFDPNKSYPVLEDIYAGPHSSFVPKSFSARQRYAALNELGFIVVKIDGMGTANRSKEFHDVCWHNLKDAGFPDRIRWMKAAAEQYPEMDLSRVGIYGGSAGGQNAAAAVLFHGDFYQVAVAGCGCHDNRMDKASWNEQWMGYPVGPQYSECSNIDNASRLKGRLMLIVGEMDTNVPPESTMRFVDALIKADKDFDLIVVPGAGHGMGGRYGERRMRDFFVEHLRDGSVAPE